MTNKLKDVECYNNKTGESIPVQAIEKAIEKDKSLKIKKMFEMFDSNPEKLTSAEIEKVVKIRRGKLDSIKNYDLFDSRFTGNKEKLGRALLKLSPSAYKCFSILVVFYTSCANTLQFKNNRNIVKDKDIASVLDISLSKWYSVRSELFDIGAIKKITFEGKTLIKVNPSIIGHSMKITKETYYAFRDDLKKEFGAIKSIYWDKLLVEEYGNNIFRD